MTGMDFDLPTVKCYILGRLMSMKSVETSCVENPSERVCVLFPGALGDFVCFLPALHELSKAHSVDLLARSDFAAIAPQAVRVQSLERLEVRRLFIDGGARDEQVRRFFAGYAVVYSWFASQERRFVEQLHEASRGRAQVFRFRPNNNDLHQSDYYLSCLGASFADASLPWLALTAGARIWCEAFCRANGLGGEPLLVLAPGSGSREKNWPEESYLQVADAWREQVGGRVVLVVGPVEAERRGFDRLSAGCVPASALDLAQLAALLARSDVYLGNDSGVSHLAAAVGARTVALFGPSDERQWAPRGPWVTILRHQTACSPCGESAMQRCPQRLCLLELSAAEVIQELRKLLEITNLTRLGVGITV